MIGEVWEEMKLNEPGRQKRGRYKSCQHAQHAKIFSVVVVVVVYLV